MIPSIGYSSYQLPWPEMEKPSHWTLSYGKEAAPTCPRCASTNTKFCYYNNYSLSQPRYLCKGCRRYWTKGGSLRNIPVGGGCRKSRRRQNNNDRRFFPMANGSKEPNDPNPDEEFRDIPSSGGSEIDLAAVFSKFVNSNQRPPSTENTATEFDQKSPPSTNDVLESVNWEVAQETNAAFGFYDPFNPIQKTEDGVSGQSLRDNQGTMEQGMFAFQSLLDDRVIQELLDCSFPGNVNQLNPPASFVINDAQSSSDLPSFSGFE